MCLVNKKGGEEISLNCLLWPIMSNSPGPGGTKMIPQSLYPQGVYSQFTVGETSK